MKSDVIDYCVYGDDVQYIEIELDPGETVIAEAGSMMFMEEGINFEAKMGDGSNTDKGLMSKLLNAGQRLLTNESLFLTHFTNEGRGKKKVYFAAPYPGKIIPIDFKKVMGKIICQRDAFLCAALGTKISVEFTKKIGAGFFGGEGFILQKLEGDGKAFIHAGGAIHMVKLEGNSLAIDPGCIVAFTKGINYDIQRAGNLKSMFFGGEGLFLANLTGTGYAWIQSLPFSRFADRIVKHAPTSGGSRRGEVDAVSAISSIFSD
ncbi:MAG: TIGR00266 family protein [Bacteriovoracaceae bacterium]|nr:TIGR00266 family protein [Bacteriovoracaceae bacterium]